MQLLGTRAFHRRERRAAVLVLAATLPLTLAAASGTPGQPVPTGPATVAADRLAEIRRDTTHRDSYTITLITGDRVHVSVSDDGRYQTKTEVAPRPDGRPVLVDVLVDADHVYVLPSDAAELVANGRLDLRLFDVRALIEDGYADDSADSLPVILTYGGRSADLRSAQSRAAAAGNLRAKAEALPGSAAGRALESINGASVSVTKKDASRFWAASVSRRGSLGAGLTGVWLDGKARPVLDRSVPQVGAPEAWASGLDGSGTKVAILDTGVDAAHPDLVGKVVASQSFVPGESVQDGHGHGTHVASTVAGSGAASGGAFTGVAPGARLVIGKVLNNSGRGLESWIIDGMEWAATMDGVRVVSMSLGSGPSDGTDPLSQAVNTLAASTGALFVIAAGNDGEYGARTVAAPAAADAALAVGAVDDNDGLAPFSSRGPRMTDYALKPEIAAPGVEISAARAGGRDSDAYTTMSGTSMAAPHVAGAAAILVQQHPDWTGEQIKAALTGTATDAGHSVYQQGAGRLDIAAAVRTTVLPSVKVDFGRTQWPHDEAPVSRTVTYRNVGDEPVTLTLSTTLKTESGDRAPEGMLTVAPAVITVPPGGTADATVTLDDTLGPVGLYTGAVTATGPGVALRTPVGLFKEPRGFELTVKVAERAGATTSANGAVIIRRIDREENEWVILPPAGSAHLFEGVYAVHSALAWADDAGDLDNLALLADPQVTLDRDRTLTLDPNAAKKVEVITDRPTEAFDTTQNFWHIPAGSTTPFGVVHRGLPYGVQLWVTPTRQVTVGKFFFEHLHLAGTPAITVRVPELGNRLLHARYQHYAATIPKLDGRLTLRVVDAGRGSAAEFARIDARGKIALIDIGDRALAPLLGHQFPREELLNAARAGAAAVFAYGNEGLPVLGQVAMLSNTYPLPTLALPADEGRALRDRLARGPATAWIDSQPSIPHLYNLAYLDRGAIPDPPRYRVADDQLVTLRQAFHGDRPTAYLYRATVTWPGLLGLDYDASWSYVDLDGIAGPFTRTEHVGPVSAEPLRYRSVSTHELGSWLGEGSTVSNALGNRETVDVFDRPLAKDERWGHAPSVPGVAVVDGADRMGMDGPLCGACRFSGLLPDGDMLALFTLTTDSDGHYGELTGYSNHPLDPERTGVDEWRLYADGVELPQHSLLGIPGLFPYFVLPAGATTYRLTQHFEDWLPEGGYGNKADTTWTFASQPPTGKQVPDGYDSLGLCVDGCRVEPLIFLRYDFTLRQDNRVSAPGAHLFTVTPYRQPSTAAMPRIAGLKVSVSVDGGRHWAPVPTVRLPNGEYLVVVVHSKVPGPNATVSLRTEAWDEAGNRVEQTLPNAYGLVGPRG